jgi:hypothetical protein
LFPEKTLEQNKKIKIPVNQPIIMDNRIPIPKPGLGKQPIIEEDLGAMDIDINTPIYPTYYPQLQGNIFQKN